MSWHVWKHEPRKLPWRKDDPNAELNEGYVCLKCDYWHRMNYPMPEATLRFLKVLDCDDYIIKSIHVA